MPFNSSFILLRLKDVSNSDVLKTHKYPVYPPIVPLPFIGYDPISSIQSTSSIHPLENHFTKNDETQPEDLALLSSSLASFTDVSGTERPISSYTGHFLREVEYNDGMIFSARVFSLHFALKWVECGSQLFDPERLGCHS